MKIFVIFLISISSMISLVKSRGDKISSYQCDKTKRYVISVTCDDNYGDSPITKFRCHELDFGLHGIDEISFNCSIPSLGRYFRRYRDIIVLNLSNITLLGLKERNFVNLLKILEINLSHNLLSRIPSNVFANNKLLQVANFSFNQISQIESLAFVGAANNLTTIDISHNFLSELDRDAFSSLENLQFLNASYNKFKIFDFNCIQSKQLNLDISWNFLHLSYLTLTPNIVSLNAAENRVDRINGVGDIVHLNVSSCGIQNMVDVIANLSSSLQSLDASFNFIGKLNQDTFAKLENLEYLTLKSTNLSNIQFTTFLHQRKVKMLDISYNNLEKINFTVFRHAFDGLESLHVDGNNLSDFDGLSKINFPQLKWLGISKNNFVCDDLSHFLRTWHYIKLVNNNPVTANHIDGIDCHAVEPKTLESAEDATATNFDISSTSTIATASKTHKGNRVHEKCQQTIVYLLYFICILYSTHFLAKFVKCFCSKRSSNNSSSEQNIVYQNNSTVL